MPHSAYLSSKEQFIDLFNNQPQILVENLGKAINQLIAEFEFEYPAGQSLYMQENLNYLKFYSNLDAIENSASYQNIYLQLCDLIHDIKDDLSQRELSSNETELYTKLLALSDATHIEDSKELPDYTRLRATAPPNLNDEFTKALQDLTAAIEFNDEHDLLFKLPYQLTQLASEISRRLTEQSRCEEDFDMKLATTIITSTTALITSTTDFIKAPYTAQTHANYLRLANYAEGAPSIGSRVAGLMLGLLGASLLVTAITLTAATVGLAAPLTAYVMTVGSYHVLAAAGILGLTGIISTLSAVGLFKEGQRSGVSYNMHQLGELRQQAQIDRQTIPRPF